MPHQHQPRGIAAPLRGTLAGKAHRSRGVLHKHRKPRWWEDRIIRHDRDDTLCRQRSADKGVEIARAALPTAAIEEHEDGRFGRVARLINIELLSWLPAIGETAVPLPGAERLPQIEQVGG